MDTTEPKINNCIICFDECDAVISCCNANVHYHCLLRYTKLHNNICPHCRQNFKEIRKYSGLYIEKDNLKYHFNTCIDCQNKLKDNCQVCNKLTEYYYSQCKHPVCPDCFDVCHCKIGSLTSGLSKPDLIFYLY